MKLLLICTRGSRRIVRLSVLAGAVRIAPETGFSGCKVVPVAFRADPISRPGWMFVWAVAPAASGLAAAVATPTPSSAAPAASSVHVLHEKTVEKQIN